MDSGFHTLRLASLAVLFLVAACSSDPGTGPVEVKWDRDVCARCNMVLSDRVHAAQIRHIAVQGGRGRVMTFDDIGCAVLWLDQQPWREQPGVEIWVTDFQTGQWIDARKARYVDGHITPMQYGLGAQKLASNGSLDFSEARAHIYRIEKDLNVHGGNLDHPGPTRLPAEE